jgi:hypothetical protein
MSGARHSTRRRAWWHESGPESCGFCLTAYHIELAYYCADCDRPVCPACAVAVRDRRVVLCPECAEKGER